MSDLPVFTRVADERIAELEAEVERLREALREIRNDGTQSQRPYHFWLLAFKALQESGDG